MQIPAWCFSTCAANPLNAALPIRLFDSPIIYPERHLYFQTLLKTFTKKF